MDRKALLIVDVQYDFLPPNGSMPVPNGDQILPFIYNLLENSEKYDLIIACLDWHPPGHISFASTHSRQPFTQVEIPQPKRQGKTVQMLWPDHCIQETHGGQIEEGIRKRLELLGPKVKWIHKGTSTEVDAYSAFADNNYNYFTSLVKLLYQNHISAVDIAGLALDYCVKNTVIDARKFGFSTRVFKAGTRPIDPAGEDAVLESLREEWGVEIVE